MRQAADQKGIWRGYGSHGESERNKGHLEEGVVERWTKKEALCPTRPTLQERA